MRRVSAPLLLGALLVLASCNHDGRSLNPANPTKNQSLLPPTTATTTATTRPPVFGPDTSAPADSSGGTDFTDTAPGENLGGDTSGTVEELGMYITLPFDSDAAIPVKYTCDGANVSPEIHWYDLPQGTVEVAIQVTDQQATGYTHWVIAGLSPSSGGIGEGQVPTGAIQATNSANKVGYTGPCPPKGQTHTYLFEVDALDQQIDLPDGTDAATLLQAIGEATIQSASDSGTVTR